jgi:hypothetical protein
MRRLRKTNFEIDKDYIDYQHFSRHVYPYGVGKSYKITPLLKLLMTPHLRSLDIRLTNVKSSNDISAVLHFATIRSPVNNKDLRV